MVPFSRLFRSPVGNDHAAVYSMCGPAELSSEAALTQPSLDDDEPSSSSSHSGSTEPPRHTATAAHTKPPASPQSTSSPVHLSSPDLHPASLRTVFAVTATQQLASTDSYTDEMMPETYPSSGSASLLSMSRRSKLDESAGEGLRRNVLLRNAMLSSLERERRQLEADISSQSQELCGHDRRQSGLTQEHIEREAQWFDDLLSELSDPSPKIGVCDPSEKLALTSSLSATADPGTEPDDDFVQLDASTSDIGQPPMAHQDNAEAPCCDQDLEGLPPSPPCTPCSRVLGSDSDAAQIACTDSGFAESASRPASAASFCTAYPNVCPYPAVLASVGSCSSEELPALVDDNSDVEDDDDDDEDENEAEGQELARSDTDSQRHILDPRPLSPPVAQLVQVDSYSIRELFSPDCSRPTSPVSCASSKGDSDSHSPNLRSQDAPTFPSLAELSLQAAGDQSLAHITDRLDLAMLTSSSSRSTALGLFGLGVSDTNRGKASERGSRFELASRVTPRAASVGSRRYEGKDKGIFSPAARYPVIPDDDCNSASSCAFPPPPSSSSGRDALRFAPAPGDLSSDRPDVHMTIAYPVMAREETIVVHWTQHNP